MIGTVSTDARAALAREAGADEIILYTRQDFETEVKRLTQDRGVDVVYDSAGQTTFNRTCRTCQRHLDVRGHWWSTGTINHPGG